MRRDRLEFHCGAIRSKEHIPLKKQYQVVPLPTYASHADLNDSTGSENLPAGASRRQSCAKSEVANSSWLTPLRARYHKCSMASILLPRGGEAGIGDHVWSVLEMLEAA